ncbi:MAG: hypothetical protein V7641_1767 [Blastocatellia bacterium]
MLDTRKAQELDLVEILEDFPEYDIKKGEIGVVVEAFDNPDEAYDLEFVDESGTSSRFAYSVKPNQIRSADETAEEAFKRGIDLFNASRHVEAEKEFNMAIDLKPEYLTMLHNLTIKYYVNSQDWLRAIVAFRFLLRLDSEYKAARDNLARAYLNFGIQQARNENIKGALDLFYSALAVESAPETEAFIKRSLVTAYTELGICKRKEGELERSVEYMAHACSIDPNEHTRRNLGLAYSFLGNSRLKEKEFSKAVFFFELAEDAGAIFPALYNNHATALAVLGEVDEAVRLFEEALKLAPDYEIAKENLNQLQMGSVEQMRQFVSSIAEIESDFDPAPPMQTQEYRQAA